METKTKVEFCVEKGDNTYSFFVPAGAPFGETYDAVFDVLSKIKEMAVEAVERSKREEKKDGQDASPEEA